MNRIAGNFNPPKKKKKKKKKKKNRKQITGYPSCGYHLHDLRKPGNR
jgi:hypothetical protein